MAEGKTVAGIVVGALAAIMTAGSAPWWIDKIPWPWGDSSDSDHASCNEKWLNRDQFNDCFLEMRKNYYPVQVKGGLDIRQEEQFWATWISYPGGSFDFLLCSALSDQRFEKLSATSNELGGSLISHSSFITVSGSRKHQAVWTKDGDVGAWLDAMRCN